MARLNDDAQWIIMMAFLICVILFVLALIIDESTIVGQTTSEGVLEFSKSDIQDLRNEVLRIHEIGCSSGGCNSNVLTSIDEIKTISMREKSSIVSISMNRDEIILHFNNGVNQYDETRYLLL
jgi:hypothetical protein